MKLVVSFADDDSFSFRDNTICIRISNINNLLSVINSEDLRAEFIDYEKMLLDADYEDDIDSEIYKVSNMPYFNDFHSFENIRVCLNKDVDFNEVYNFLEKFSYRVIIDTDDLDLKDVYDICSKHYEVEPLIRNRYNTESISASEMKSSLDVVFDFSKKFNDEKLSPLEKVMFVYDYLKTRIYKEDDNYSNSASLSKVTTGDSIVCLGYANLFCAICNLIGIFSDVKVYKNNAKKRDGHASAISYIDDDKYNFHGILEFDPTWDSRKNERDKIFISNYYWFGMSPMYSEKLKKQNSLVPLGESGCKLLWYFNRCYDFLDAELVTDDDFKKRIFTRLFEQLEKEFEMAGFEEGIYLVRSMTLKDNIDRSDLEHLQETYLKLYKTNLGYDEFLKLLYFVRRSEFVFNDDYVLDFDDVVSISRRRETRKNLLAYILFNDRDEYLNVTRIKEFKSIPESESKKILYDKKRLELVKTLRNVAKRNK